MAKITLSTLTSAFNAITKLNANFSSIQTHLRDKVLYRDNPVGEANQMENDLDMNDNDIQNVGSLDVTTLNVTTMTIGGEAVVLGDLASAPAGSVNGNVIASGTLVQAQLADGTLNITDGATKLSGPLGASYATRYSQVNFSTGYNTTYTAITDVIPKDDTVPLVSEGAQILTASITPKSNQNYIKADITIHGSVATGTQMIGAVFRGNTCIWAGVIIPADAGGNDICVTGFSVLDGPATTSATTYTVRVGMQSGGTEVRINGTTGRLFGGASTCSLLLSEIKGP